MKDNWLIYGATGYTGTLIAEEAVIRGHQPILAGRDEHRLRALAERLNLEWRAFSLEDEHALMQAADSVHLFLNAAGGFPDNCANIMNSCLSAATHYLDISNHISVLQAAQARHRSAIKKGIAIVPGVGFGTVASNCLIKQMCAHRPHPVSLEVVISPHIAQKSAGAAQSTLETIAQGGCVRRHGNLSPTRFGHGARRIHTARGIHNVIPIPSGDLEAAYMVSRATDITVYMPTRLSPFLARFVLPLAERLLSIKTIRQRIERWIAKQDFASKAQKNTAAQHSWVWVKASYASGDSVEASLTTGEGYDFTASASVLAIERVLANKSVGAMSPGSALGVDFVQQIAEVHFSRTAGSIDSSAETAYESR